MQANLRTDRATAVIQLAGRFDFSARREFGRCCDQALQAALQAPDVRAIEVDLKDVAYLDSSALGMLLLLKERAEARELGLALSNCTGLVREILDVARFDAVMSIR
jgi:anti-anti-sigma factor